MLAVETGIPHTVWLDDTRAMYTATRYLERRAEMLRRRR
jgi:hypothetical protein